MSGPKRGRQSAPLAERALAGDSVFLEDFPLVVRRQGYDEQAYFTFCYSPVCDGSGTVVGFMDTVVETTGKFLAQQRLQDLAATLDQQVADRTADRNRLWLLSDAMLVVTRLDGTIAAVNPAWQATLGYSEDETIGRRILSFIHDDEAVRVPDDVQRLAEAVRHQATLRFRHRSGADRWIDWTAVPGDGFVQAVGRDVTDERARTEALLQSQERVRHSQKMEAIGQLTGGIAHDFNNMLQGVVLPLQLIGQRHARGHMDDIPRYVEAGLSSARRAAALTQRLLAFSRRQPLDVRPVDAAASIRNLEPMLRNTCGENTRLDIEIPEDLWPVLTDVHQLESAVLNLAINARDAMPEGGRLRIAGDNLGGAQALPPQVREALGLPPGDLVRLQVSDTGHGMSKEVLDLAFDPFFTTKPIGQGTGLGLSMIYGYMRQSGGAVALESEEGRGTCVSLYFPRSSEEVSDEAPAGLDSAEAGKRPDSVLVVEDDATVREFVCELLRDLGFQVLSASSGAGGHGDAVGRHPLRPAGVRRGAAGAQWPAGGGFRARASSRHPGAAHDGLRRAGGHGSRLPGRPPHGAHRQAVRCPGAGAEGAGHGGHARPLSGSGRRNPGKPAKPRCDRRTGRVLHNPLPHNRGVLASNL